MRYGDGDNYPSVTSVEIDGYVKGKLKHSGIATKAKIGQPELGNAVSFAQTDVIERLLGGADPRYVAKTSKYLSDIAQKLAPEIVRMLAPKISQKRKKSEAEFMEHS